MTLNIESGKTYIIINNRSGTVMDMSTKIVPGEVHGWHRHGKKNQQWQLTFADQGWHFKNLENGQYLAYDGEPENGTKIVVKDVPFLWEIFGDLDPQKQGTIRITVPATNFDVDLDSGKVADGTVIHLWTRHREGQQLWRFEKV